MKKFALTLFMILAFQASTHAYIEEYSTSDVSTLHRAGYSMNILKTIETSRMLSQGSSSDYVPFFSRKIYSDNPLKKFYQVAHRYFDPNADTGTFGAREIYFENSFFDQTLSPTYNSYRTPNDKYERYYASDLQRMEHAGKLVPGSNGFEYNSNLIPDYIYRDSQSQTSIKKSIDNL